MGPERVDPDPALSSQSVDVVGIDDLEAEAELLTHLPLPLQAEARRADHEDPPGLVAEHELLHDETRLDGLAQANVIGDQQVHAGHPQSPHQRQKLVVLDIDACPERRLERARIRRGNGSPPHGIEESGEYLRLVHAFSGVGKLGLRTNLRARLDLTEDAQRRRAPLVVDRGKTHQVVPCPSIRIHCVRWTRRLTHRLDHPIAVPHTNTVYLFRHRNCALRLDCRHAAHLAVRLVPSIASESDITTRIQHIPRSQRAHDCLRALTPAPHFTAFTWISLANARCLRAATPPVARLPVPDPSRSAMRSDTRSDVFVRP